MPALRPNSQGGFALVLVLGFVVLLTFLIVAFFADATMERRVSNSSANQSKVALFARGALDTTIGDLRQEIVDGSVPIAVTAGSTTYTLYAPKAATGTAPSTMAPAYQITPGFTPAFDASGMETDGLANVLKLSADGVPFYSQSTNSNYAATGPTRASNVSTTTPSQNGRYISKARWNAPLLMPATSTTDATPAAGTGFTAPSWILVANDGANPKTTGNNVVGRYAYCIYNEGGLLDANVAGYPANTDQGTGSRKLGAASADLTQLGLTSAQIDSIVGWRNYASAQPVGSFPSFTFDVASGLKYFNAAFGNTTGFMTVGNTALYKGVYSDQKFSSRQQLIDLLLRGVANGSTDNRVLTTLQNSLQYLGTFSRTVDQPSFSPNPNFVPDATRPKVVANSTSSGVAPFTAPYAGGNNAFGSDDAINPFFLQVPVTATFTRRDGTQAKVGTPLVNKRFSLRRLAWLTYKGPSSSNMGDVTVQQAIKQLGGDPTNVSDPVYQFVAQGTAANIFNSFGLSWVPNPDNSRYSEWVYNHQGDSPLTVAPAAGTSTSIKRLQSGSNIVSGRDPDFFELLKAAITVGTLGKASASCHVKGRPTEYDVQQYNSDTSTDYQILQIGANIIDQFDNDSYPTNIRYSDLDFHGDEDIPYLYRVRAIGLNIAPVTGAGMMMALPEVWNPHSPTSNPPTTGPTDYRFLATIPIGNQLSYTASAQCRAFPGVPPNNDEDIGLQTTGLLSSVPLDNPSTANSGASGATELNFQIPLSTASTPLRQEYHEPLFIGGERQTDGSPVGVASVGQAPPSNKTFQYGADTAGFITDAASKIKYCGFLLGQFPLSFISDQWKRVNGSTPMPPGQQVYPMPVPPNNPANPSSVDQCVLNISQDVVYYLQYKDASGNWNTYQQKSAVLPTLGQVSATRAATTGTVANPKGKPINMDISGAYLIAGAKDSYDTGAWMTWLDARTSRFGAFGANYERPPSGSFTATGGYYGLSDQPTIGSYTYDGITYGAFGHSCYYYAPGTALQNDFLKSASAARIGWYPGDWSSDSIGARMFVPGYYGQNVTGVQPSPHNNGNFYADPDGVVRRAMGAFAGASPTSTVGLPHSALSTSATQSQSRPFVLNRPFRSVAELGYTFSGTPWKNIDFTFPESGFASLLDVFCVNDTPDPNALKAGQVDLNTRQLPVLQAILSGSNNSGLAYNAYKDEATAGTTAGSTSTLASSEVQQIAKALLTRTTSAAAGKGALANVSELVGKWSGTSVPAPGASSPFNIDGSQSYVGLSGDLSTTASTGVFADTSSARIARLRESAIRALSAAGQTRTWTLLIDLVAQTGRYRAGEGSAAKFIVDGEQRCWLHVAIDRFTGKVVDEQLERVKE